MVEYAYIHTLNGKVVGLRPGTQAHWSAVLAHADYDAVLNRLRIEGRWEVVNPKFRPAEAGASLIRIWREVSSEPIIPSDLLIPADLREKRIEVQSTLDDSEVEKIQHAWEVKGWDLYRILGKERKSEFMTLVFTKAKTAPE
jgi:hypothetical protein